MSRSTLTRAFALSVAMAVTACGSDKPGGESSTTAGAPPAQPAEAAGPNVVTVTARDFSFEAPAEIPAGLTAFRLVSEGPSLHHVALLQFDGEKTLADFLAAMKGEGGFPSWAHEAGGPAPPKDGGASTTIQMLEPGNYGMVCFIPSADGMPHVMKGMSHALKVVAATGAPAPEPEADIVVKLVDYDFQLSAPLTPGKHTLRIENAGPQSHEIAIVKLNPGKTPLDFTAWGMKPVGPPPGMVHGGISGMQPGTHAFVEVDLPPGEYGLLCFLPDAKDGKPHFVHGMAKPTTVKS